MLALSSPLMLMIPLCAMLQGASGPKQLLPELQQFVEAREAEFEAIPAERRESLEKLAQYIRTRVEKREPIRLVFICTHNSRRSHLGHIWAATAAARYGVDGVEAFSGGTEVTAFNPRAVAAVKRAGFHVQQETTSTNPRYAVHYLYGEGSPSLDCFSKIYSDPANPTRDFCAVMTCDHADKSCPTVRGASARIAIPYSDPKQADDTDQETARYDERNQQIARELLYVFSRATCQAD